ncbi:DNA glycosylase [Armatimonas sp.]|uniref:DNA glycosylase n=1 Tax=Armatimonas sp. TaxID=1872638 RepID=UPI00286A2246|nr:DNA glycosylase [Armatimonas sp.]
MISANLQELDLLATLFSGQMFRWQLDEEGWCVGAVGEHTLRLRQQESIVELAGVDEFFVRSFLRLDDLSLTEQARRWCALDPLFAEAWKRQPGLRLLRQDPNECFFSFLCASVAPIARISQMLQAVCEEAAGDPFGPFPTLEQLLVLRESRLRERGLGFRAERVVASARKLAEKPDGWLESLRGKPLVEIEGELTQFPGIGRKIADCIALFSLDADSAVPMDTHIWRIAKTHYAPELRDASLTPANYERASAAFQRQFGPYAGWAQQTLFYQQAVK